MRIRLSDGNSRAEDAHAQREAQGFFDGDDLLGTVRIRPCDEFLGDGLSQLITRIEVDLVVDSGPDTRIASFFSDRADLLCVERKQISENLRSGGRKS